MILLLGDDDDPVIRDALGFFARRGAAAEWLDCARFPGEVAVTMAWTARGAPAHELVIGGRHLALADVTGVWHRNVSVGRPTAVADRRARAFAQHEAEAVLLQLWSQLAALFVPAPWERIRDGQRKLHQLALAASLGFEVPASIVTSDPAALLGFVRAHGGRCIAKHVAHTSCTLAGLDDELMRFTEPVTLRDLAAYKSARLAPVYAQAYVAKRVELRVTVVGDQVFAAEVSSQDAARTRHDYRRLDHRHARYRVHALPDQIAARCRAITAALGLCYGALDLVLTPDDRYVFLEINPRGEFHWVEQLTGLPITRAICELLLARCQPGGAHAA
jgi:glutathione synthase/RimK-type ligase-like ATP-grasp enzyme